MAFYGLTILHIDYLTLWNHDSGLVGGGVFCAYSYFGLDQVIQQLSSHDLDNERSAILVAAPTVNGNFNYDPNAYSLYGIYAAAHEGSFFDQSVFYYPPQPLPAGNHVYLVLSLQKHSTYGGNPDFYPITPYYFIAGTYAAIFDGYYNGFYGYDTLQILLSLADDVFYGCIVERWAYQDGYFAQIRTNVGEPDVPINASHFIQDTNPPNLKLYPKLKNPLWLLQ